MGNLQDAGAGIRKVYIASVGAVVCAVLAIIPIVQIFAAIGVIVFAVLSMVGLHQAGRDIEGCKLAFTLTIVNIAVNVVGIVFAKSPLAAVFTIADYIISFVVVYLVCTSVSAVMEQLGAADVAQKGALVWKINAVCYLIPAVVTILAKLPGFALLAGIISFVVAILSLIAGILYMIFLGKSSQVLS